MPAFAGIFIAIDFYREMGLGDIENFCTAFFGKPQRTDNLNNDPLFTDAGYGVADRVTIGLK
jgi:hypothetical protein